MAIERIERVVSFISQRIPQYTKLMNIPDLEILEIIAKSRRVNYTNWFQDAYIPDLDAEKTMVFEKEEDFYKKFPSGKSTCPNCGGISTDYYDCNSGLKIGKGKKAPVCNWKAYGFLRSGKELSIIVKSRLKESITPQLIFPPIELKNEKN